MSNKYPLVSVMLPAYNHENFIEECITSILEQTYPNIELLIIDDGSKDNTWDKICALKSKCEKRFAYFEAERQENKGLASTLNKLIQKVKGKYICNIASDDATKPNMIVQEVTFLENNPDYVLVVGNNELINAESQTIGYDENFQPVPLTDAKYKTFGELLKARMDTVDFNSDDFGSYETLVKGNYIPNGIMHRASAMKQIGGYTKDAPLEDWYMNMQLAKIGKMKYLNEVLFRYRLHGENTIKKSEYMRDIAEKTRIYEQKIVNKPENAKFKQIFEEENCYKKINFRLGNIISLYKQVDVVYKKKILEIFGHKIVLKTRRR